MRNVYVQGAEPSARITPTVGQNGRWLPAPSVLTCSAGCSVPWLCAALLGPRRCALDARVPEESDSSYRDAACAALFGVVRQVAASNGQSVCVLVSQTDVVTVKEKHSDAEAVVRDVKQGITQRWEELARGAVDVGTLRPVLHYMRASAKTGYARDWRSCVADLQRRNSRAGGAPVY